MEDHRTLVIAEQKLEGDGLIALLKNLPWISLISKTESIENITKKFSSDNIDLIVVDINHIDSELMFLFSNIKGHFNKSKFFVISSSDNITFVSQLLKLGINGYIHKSASQENLTEALETIANNEIFLQDNISQKLLQNFTIHHKNSNDCQDGSCLTKREHDILMLLVNAKSSSQIADELFISELTVNTHRKHILKKMGFSSTASLIKYAVENGIA